MKNILLVQQIKIPIFYLQLISVALATIYIHLHLRTENYSNLGFSIVFLGSAFSLLLDKRHGIKLGSCIEAVLLGMLVIIVLLSIVTLYPREKILGFSPFVGAFGVALLASGFNGLKQYVQELLILFIYGISKAVPSLIPDISPITAKFSTYILWVTGFNPVLEGSYLMLPNGGIVDVAPTCSGIYLITYMLALAALMLVMFPSTQNQRIALPIIAVALGFITNGIRVAILAYLSAPIFPKAFDYWHSQDGSFIFNIVPVILLILYCVCFVNSPSELESSQ